MSTPLDPVAVQQKTGEESFHDCGRTLPFRVLDFWRQSASDLLNNAMRGVLAEFLVARALNGLKPARDTWDAFDLEAPGGLRVEVKSAAYVQSWRQSTYSKIEFRIPATQAWEPKTGTYSPERRRQADVYVFCVLDHKDQKTIDPLDIAQWQFLVIGTDRLNAELAGQKSAGLATLRRIGTVETDYDGLAAAVTGVGAGG